MSTSHSVDLVLANSEVVDGLCEGLFVKENILSPPPSFCESGGPFAITRSKTFVCQGERLGQTRFIWKTVGTSSSGFDDDE